MASNIKVDIVKPTATNGSLSLKGDSGGSATANGITVDSSGNTSITGTTTISSADINGGTIDNVTLGTNSAVTEAQVGNININNNTISSTNSNGDINLQPNGTGEVFADGPLKVGETAAFLGDHIAVNGSSSIIPSAGTYFPGFFATAPSSFRFTALSNAAVLNAGLYSDNTFKSYRSSTQGAAQISVNASDSSIRFLNTPTTSGTVDSEITDFTERMLIDSSGNVELKSTNAKLILPSGGGIDFNAYGTGTNISSNLLDDYEEGTFTLTGKSSGGTTLFTSTNQPYQKIGNRCFVEIYLNNSTGTNATKFEGLPFAASGDHWAPNSQTLSRVVTINNGNDYITWATASNAGQIIRMQISYTTV